MGVSVLTCKGRPRFASTLTSSRRLGKSQVARARMCFVLFVLAFFARFQHPCAHMGDAWTLLNFLLLSFKRQERCVVNAFRQTMALTVCKMWAFSSAAKRLPILPTCSGLPPSSRLPQ